ncbi:MAG: FAD-binding oxidoreductase [Ktedonobacteraceae bacterium]|nr:FAD-binding oxidoreductase [Ktedonobacteraceae bacterium]
MNLSMQSLQTVLESLVGARVRLAKDEDVVAGVRPQLIVEPGSEEEVASVLALADKEGLRVVIRGGGTQLSLGAPPAGADILLSTARLNQIIEHVPHDLTVTVEAGLPLVTLQETLGQANQWLALDPDLSPAATIGGIVATNATGPRRLRYGGVRDQIIGVRVVLADGTIAKGGGKVVKNVAGYDLPKLFTGSLGTLGVIVSATFRLYPLPPTSRTVYLTSSILAPLCDLSLQVTASTLVATSINIVGATSQRDTYVMAVRFETSPEAAEDQSATFVEMATSKLDDTLQTPRILKDESEAQIWSQVLQHKDSPDSASQRIGLKVSLLPTEVARWLTSLEQVCQRLSLEADWQAYAGHGLVFVDLAGDETVLQMAVPELRQLAMEHRGSVVVTEAPPHLAAQLDMWGDVSGLEVMRNLKARFDPRRVLNPGRFVGGI